MAAGATVLSGVAIAPGVLIAGITIGINGSKAKTKASKLRSKVSISVERMKAAADLLKQIRQRADELRAVLTETNSRTLASLERLKAVEFDPDLHAELLLESVQLIRATSELLDTQLLDETGQLTDESIHIIERNRDV